MSENHLGVAALGAASQHAAPQTALVTLHVGLRDNGVEPIVARLCGTTDTYRTTTAITSIGYVSPEAAWLEWLVAEQNAPEVAQHLAHRLESYGRPYLHRLAEDPGELIAAARLSPSRAEASGTCRVAVLLARHGRTDDARDHLSRMLLDLGTRTDAAADNGRRMVDQTQAWLEAPNS